MTKLEAMLKYVSEHNDFYKNRIKEYEITNPLDITQWPVLTRKELQENRYNMFSDGYKAKYYNQQLRRQSSSGSSGMPVNIYWDKESYFRSTMSLWRLRNKYHGISPLSRKVSFSLMNFELLEKDEVAFSFVTENSINFNYSNIYNEQKMIEVMEIIHQFKPEWIYAQPSVLLRMLQCCKKNNISPIKSLAYIESIGELLPLHLQKQLTEFFCVPIVNMYGSEENNGIAYECPYGKMHIINDNVKVEVLSNGKITDSGEGEAIITNLNNRAMPLIRYNQEDNIKLVNHNVCLCKNSLSSIEVINGRQSDVINHGELKISTFFLNELIAETQNQFNDPISYYYFCYFKRQNKIEARIVIDFSMEKWTSEIISNLQKTFAIKTKGMSEILFEVIVYDDMCLGDPTKNKYKILYIED